MRDFEKTVSGIFLDKYNDRMERNSQQKTEAEEGNGEDDEQTEGHLISKENLAIREALTDMKVGFEEEKMLPAALFKADFYVPQANLAIEINGKSHFYPYSTRFNNFTNLKNKMIRNNGYNILNLNSWMLEGMLRDPERKGLKDLIQKTVKTYTDKTNGVTSDNQ